MLLEEFVPLVEKRREERPVWFGLDSDPPATPAQIQDVEAQLGVRLPESYRLFVTMYGGGYFALGNLFSVFPGSDWNIVERNRDIFPVGFLAVSDNGVGDLYGFRVTDGACDSEIVLFDHETGMIAQPKYSDLFEFLGETALKPR
ncbi:MAG: SMI1/KNR4 family protein [Pirellulales bacterium]